METATPYLSTFKDEDNDPQDLPKLKPLNFSETLKALEKIPHAKDRAIAILEKMEENNNILLEATALTLDLENQCFEIEARIQESVASSKELTSDVKRRAAANHIKATDETYCTSKALVEETNLVVKQTEFVGRQLDRYYKLQLLLLKEF